VSPVRISHIESALAGVSEEWLRRLAANYVCSDDELIDALVALATGLRSKLDALATVTANPECREAGLWESAASRVVTWRLPVGARDLVRQPPLPLPLLEDHRSRDQESAAEFRVRGGVFHIPDDFVEEHVAEGYPLGRARAGD
jgi:hypothetical protein